MRRASVAGGWDRYLDLFTYNQHGTAGVARVLGSSSLVRAAAAGVWVILLAGLVGCTQEAESRPKPAGREPKVHLVELAAVEVGTLRTEDVYTGSLRHRQTVRIFNQEEAHVRTWGEKITRR